MRGLAGDSVDLAICSPPYEAQRTYGIGFDLKGQAWVDWMRLRAMEMVRITRGVVVIVCDGFTEHFRYSASPLLLAADLHRAGVHLRKPPIYYRKGIPGSGGPDWWRNDYEFCIVASKGGRLPWSDNTAVGEAPKYAPGGAMSSRHKDGRRANDHASERCKRRMSFGEKVAAGAKIHTKTESHGGRRKQAYLPPAKANPGNVIRCKVGGGLMGSDLAHENEAPFPESLVEPFVLSFCPPGGLVFDAFSGSGTTAAVALKHGRRFLGCDIRQSQVDLTLRRVASYQPNLF